ncbi:MAG: hypothetical protein ACXVNN_09160, partial [Bacteroidia bacterium]
MKAKFYLFLLFSLFAFNSKGQTPASFPKDSAQWLNHSYGYITMDGAQYDTLYFYTMQGDTTITSINYKKLSLFKHYINYSNGTFGFLPESTIGALRYDSVLNEVYYYSYSSGIEKLAYKFDLATGDNFETNYTPYTFDSLITRAVDSTIIFTPYTGTQFTKNVRYLFHSNCGWP